MSARPGPLSLEAALPGLERAAGCRFSTGHRVVPLIDGPAIFARMLDAIAGARHTVHLENYIIRDDRIGGTFAEALARRAREGIAVRVLFDWLGCKGTSRRYWRRLRHAGVEVRAFQPPALLEPLANLVRDHRKGLVTDGRLAIVGGHCIGDEWAGDAAAGIPPWRDTALEVEGPAAARLDQAFARMWARAGAPLRSPADAPADAPAGDARVAVLESEPGLERAYRCVEWMATAARSRCWITDAYFVAPPRLREVLGDAARDGVDVRLLVPGDSDLPHVRNLTRIGYRPLLRAGVRIFEWRGPMLHAKSIVTDGQWARVGSSNLNASSLSGNYELDLLVDDAALATGLQAQFLRDLDRSREVVVTAPAAPARLRPPPLALVPGPGPDYHAPPRERRRRLFALGGQLALVARRQVALGVAVGFAIVALLFAFFPRPSALATAVLAGWLALGALVRALRRPAP